MRYLKERDHLNHPIPAKLEMGTADGVALLAEARGTTFRESYVWLYQEGHKLVPLLRQIAADESRSDSLRDRARRVADEAEKEWRFAGGDPADLS